MVLLLVVLGGICSHNRPLQVVELGRRQLLLSDAVSIVQGDWRMGMMTDSNTTK